MVPLATARGTRCRVSRDTDNFVAVQRWTDMKLLLGLLALTGCYTSTVASPASEPAVAKPRANPLVGQFADATYGWLSGRPIAVIHVDLPSEKSDRTDIYFARGTT